MVLLEVIEETAGADRVPGNFEIVNVPGPVLANLVDRRHAEHYTFSSQLSAFSVQLTRSAEADTFSSQLSAKRSEEADS
jgi:hypothetical protein